MAHASSRASLLLAALLALQLAAGALAARSFEVGSAAAADAAAGAVSRHHHKKKKVHPYTSPSNLFIQERASKQLPGPGQHFSFGALRPWDEILSMLEEQPASTRKLLLVVRHGQAVSNFLSDTLGPDAWFRVEGTCTYSDKNATTWGIFDAGACVVCVPSLGGAGGKLGRGRLLV